MRTRLVKYRGVDHEIEYDDCDLWLEKAPLRIAFDSIKYVVVVVEDKKTVSAAKRLTGFRRTSFVDGNPFNLKRDNMRDAGSATGEKGIYRSGKSFAVNSDGKYVGTAKTIESARKLRDERSHMCNSGKIRAENEIGKRRSRVR